MKATIYHNSLCSKSNAALQLLLEYGVELDIVNYLTTPFSAEALQSLLAMLNLEAKALIRFNEPIAKELHLSKDDMRDQQEWIALMMQHPILIERPIVLMNNKAVIARPTEAVLDLIRPYGAL